MMVRFSLSYSSCVKMPWSRRFLAISRSSYICLTLDIFTHTHLRLAAAPTDATPSARRRRRLARGVSSNGHECTWAQAQTLLSTKTLQCPDRDDRRTRRACCLSGQRSTRRERLTDMRGCANEWHASGEGGAEEAAKQNHDALANGAAKNLQEPGARASRWAKKMRARGCARRRCVCTGVCRGKAGQLKRAQQVDVVHRERHSQARAARGGERREEGGRTDGAHGGRKTTPRTTAVWGRGRRQLRVRDHNLSAARDVRSVTSTGGWDKDTAGRGEGRGGRGQHRAAESVESRTLGEQYSVVPQK